MPVTTRPGSAPGLVDVLDVEICRVGTWATSTGVFDFTLEDFAAAVAAEADPEVFDAPLKVGHTDPRFATAGLDGEPALGWVRNLRIAGDRLKGDLLDVPAKLAEIMPHALPRRSVEMGFQVHTPSGGRYRAAVLGLALLGVTPPAVSGLADVYDLFSGAQSFEVAAASAALCAGGVASFLVDPAWADARASIVVLAARAGVDGSELVAVVDRLAGMPAASSPTAATAADTLRPHVVPTPPGGQMAPLTDARVRELLALEANADAEAALVALRNQANAGTTAPPVAPPAPVPGTGPFLPAGYTPPPVAAPVAAPPAAVAPPVAAPVPAPPAGYQYDATGQLVAIAPAPVAAPVAIAPVAPPPGAVTPPAPVAAPPAPSADMAAFAAAVAAQLQPAIAAAAAPGMQVAETLRVRDREAMLAGHARRGALRPADIDYYRGQYDTNPVGTIAHLAASPVQFPTFELGVAAASADTVAATAEADRQFLAACGITIPD